MWLLILLKIWGKKLLYIKKLILEIYKKIKFMDKIVMINEYCNVYRFGFSCWLYIGRWEFYNGV